MRDHDVCVIGCGPSGFAAAVRAWDLGKRVCVIERGRLGGAGVHDGALSSKTLWELSRDYRGAIARDRGYVAEHVHLDWNQVSRVVEEALSEKVAQMATQLEELARPSPEHGGRIELVHGTARFVDPHTIEVSSERSALQRITADHFIVATGSRPRTLPSVDIDGRDILTSDHFGALDAFPRSLVILGAGVVGCEFTTIFANFGKTKVYLIDRADRILPFEDEDVARMCARNLEAKGVTVHHRSKLVSLARGTRGVDYTIEHASGARETITVEKALISIGRVPNTDSIGLEGIGIAVGENGHLECDDTRTVLEHVYAVGDITYDVALVNVAEIEGRHAAERICGVTTERLSYENLSTIMFLDPEVAAIGLNEMQAQQRRIPYKVAVYSYALVNRPIAMRATAGFVKLLVTDDHDMRILGMRALGVHASTTLEAVSLMIQHGRSARELAELLHPHPAVTEGLQDCVRMLLGTSIYKPSVFRNELRLSRITYDASGNPETA